MLQKDIDAGEILDVASVTASSPAPSSSERLASTSCTCDLPRQPGIAIVKATTDVTTARGRNASATDAGDIFAYRITVSNTGNTWLSDVNISDPMFEDLACSDSYEGSDSRFAPGGSIECTALLTLEQDHIDNGCVGGSANVRMCYYSCFRGSVCFNVAGSSVCVCRHLIYFPVLSSTLERSQARGHRLGASAPSSAHVLKLYRVLDPSLLSLVDFHRFLLPTHHTMYFPR